MRAEEADALRSRFPEYVRDRLKGDRLMEHVKQIVGRRMLVEAPNEADNKYCADLIRREGVDHIAVRVREPGYAERYPDQFTMRANRTSGMETELSKITRGYGDWMFYGHADAQEERVAVWWLIDLGSFRTHYKRFLAGQCAQLITGETPNKDGKTSFRHFKISSFPADPPLLIASSKPRLVSSQSAAEVEDATLLAAKRKEMTWRATRESMADDIMRDTPTLTRAQALDLAQMRIDIENGDL